MRPVGRWSGRTTVVGMAAAAATISALVVGGIAVADNGSGTETDDSGTTANQTSVRDDGAMKVRDRMGLGPRLHGLAGGPVLHGEFVVPNADGDGYQTMATQHGTVEEVGDSSITVKSEDGYTRSYTIDDETLVNAQREGIDSVEKGDQVAVAATVGGETATAVRVADISQRKAVWEKLRPGRPGLEERLKQRFGDDFELPDEKLDEDSGTGGR
jgi:hypothetical protein